MGSSHLGIAMRRMRGWILKEMAAFRDDLQGKRKKMKSCKEAFLRSQD